jgi:hypothetical protein
MYCYASYYSISSVTMVNSSMNPYGEGDTTSARLHVKSIAIMPALNPQCMQTQITR